ncbi:MAG: holo-ACP synthase [Bacteroidetes bacterium]|nr:holo-ACP synthase [Bacteroidota bacterium]
MIVGIGVDIIEVERIKKIIINYSDAAINKIFTKTEKNYCEQFNERKYEHYAARFATKEAFSKAIGTGFNNNFKLNEIGIFNIETGKPQIELFGNLLEKYGKYKIHISIAHLKEYAVANVVIEE